MPDAVVAVIQLHGGRVGVVAFADAYEPHVRPELEKLGKLETIDFPGCHTNTLPPEIRTGNLDEFVLMEERKIAIVGEEYPLHVYEAPYDKVYEIIKRLSPD